MKSRLQELLTQLGKLTNKQTIETVYDKLHLSADMLKQISITLGFFLSFYRDVDSFELAENLPELRSLMENFQIAEVFTDIDQVQALVDDITNVLEKKVVLEEDE